MHASIFPSTYLCLSRRGLLCGLLIFIWLIYFYFESYIIDYSKFMLPVFYVSRETYLHLTGATTLSHAFCSIAGNLWDRHFYIILRLVIFKTEDVLRHLAHWVVLVDSMHFAIFCLITCISISITSTFRLLGCPSTDIWFYTESLHFSKALIYLICGTCFAEMVHKAQNSGKVSLLD